MPNLSLPLQPHIAPAQAATCTLFHGDCLTVMPKLKPQSIAFAFCDLPYACTLNAWDKHVDLEKMWASLARITRSTTAIAFTATQKFACALINSQPALFKYDLIWEKHCPSNGNMAKKRPLNYHEHVLVFYNKQPTYHPQMLPRLSKRRGKTGTNNTYLHQNHGTQSKPKVYDYTDYIYPKSILRDMHEGRHHSVHPTQKPIALLEWLIQTYTNEGDTVLDPTMGSGTTGAACARLGRHFVGIERDAAYFKVAADRIAAERFKKNLPVPVMN